MKELCLLIGLPGSGKSTYAKKNAKRNNSVVLSSDEIREELFGCEFNDTIKHKVLKELLRKTINLMKDQSNVIIDTTFLNEEVYRNEFIERVNEQIDNVNVKAIIFDTDISVCLIRDKNREKNRMVGQEIINSLSKVLSISDKGKYFSRTIRIRTTALTDKEFRQLEHKIPLDHKINSRGTIIGCNQYKPDISIVNSKEKVTCCIESSSTGDRKATLGEMLQAEKYANDNNLFIDLIICLAGSSKNSPTPRSQKAYLEPYFTFLKKSRYNEKIGINRIYLIEKKDYIDHLLDAQTILNDVFVNSCEVLK